MTQDSDDSEFEFVLKLVEVCDSVADLDALCLRIKNDIGRPENVANKEHWTQTSWKVDHLRGVCKEHARLLKLCDSIEWGVA